MNEVTTVGEGVELKEADSGESLRDRLCTIIDEACGLQPVMTADELLTFLERRLFEDRCAREVLRREAETRERAAAAVRGDYESLEYAAAVLLRELRRVLPEDGGIDRFDAVRRAMRTIASDGRPGWEERVLAGHGGIEARRREAETREVEARAAELGRRECRALLVRLVKYVREDRAVTPGTTRLARLTDQVADYLRRTADPSDILREGG